MNEAVGACLRGRLAAEERARGTRRPEGAARLGRGEARLRCGVGLKGAARGGRRRRKQRVATRHGQPAAEPPATPQRRGDSD